MIPSTPTQLLVASDWKKIYQSFKNADFTSYDFDTLKRTMISYLQENYPEDFNDFIESSEYIALVDLIAFVGQNLSFRIDLNARENFLETATRRDSILKLAQLISYAPTRNVPASGFLKITAISTTDTVIDSNGINLANNTVGWNDSTNANWNQQFTSIMNSAMTGSTAVGNPVDRQIISGIQTDQYRLNSANTDIPVYSFLKNINGTSMNFEIVPSTIASSLGQYAVAEAAPQPAGAFSFIYQNDNQGTSSSNTGFFTYFRQGSMSVSNFAVTTPVPNEIIGVNTPSINDSDVWLWQLNPDGTYPLVPWTKIPNLVGNNVIYNSISAKERNIYSVTSRDRDQIDLNFADGSFGNLPKGQFRLFYRQSNGLTYSIAPAQMSGIVIRIPYYNKSGQMNTLTMTMSLQYTVNNSSGTESNASIQNKAPQSYYLQNRMVTAEDYNIAPLKLGNDILKVKSINRVSSGISKYFELSDISGKNSSTSIFATDGIVYQDTNEQSFNFSLVNNNAVLRVLKQQVAPILASTAVRSFYFEHYSRPQLAPLNLNWVQVNKTSGQSRGYFAVGATSVTVGLSTASNLRYITPGALIKFVPPAGRYFAASGKIVSVAGPTTVDYLWSTVITVIGDGNNSGVGALSDGTGPVVLSNLVDSAAIPVEVIPKFVNVLSYAYETTIIDLCLAQQNFGLSFDLLSRSWHIITGTNLDLSNPFSLTYQNDNYNSNKDASWTIAFVWSHNGYTVRYRQTDYIFESNKQTSFFIDQNNLNYNFVDNTLVKDQINVLSLNTSNSSNSVGIGKDYIWQIDGSIIAADGYVEPKKVKISFYDYNNSGQINDPDSFNNIVKTKKSSLVNNAVVTTYVNDKFVFFQTAADGVRYQLVDSAEILVAATPNDIVGTIVNGDLYYFYDPQYNVVNQYVNNQWTYEPNYFAFPGRATLKFHYLHNSGANRRIDPSKTNIIDIYLLSSSYDSAYRSWLLNGSIGLAPLAPTSLSLEQNFASKLEPIKTISDEIVFQPVNYKVLFGSTAAPNLQATFKAVRNPLYSSSDNDLSIRILNIIRDFFALENWDFGQSFNFSELSAYVMNQMTPAITNFIIVPKAAINFGSLYEISCLSNEIFISGASITDIQIIDIITATQINSTLIIGGARNS